MKKLIVAIFLTALLVGSAFSFDGSGAYFETLTFDNTADSKGITSSLYSTGNVKAKGALVSVETQSIRYTLNGTAASSTVGHLLASDSSILIDGYNNVANFRCVSITDNTAVVKVTTFF